jgi:micrococcal nuclease
MINNVYTGRVLDGETKTKVEGAKITLELYGKSDIVHSDSEGFYQFCADLREESASARIRVEAEEYEKYNRNIVLTTKDNKIEEIHLTSTKKKPKGSLDKIAAVATVIGTIIAIATYVSTNPVSTGQPNSGKLEGSQPKPEVLSKQNCYPAYPDLCVPKDSPDLKCSDVKERNFKVLSPDPHGFDRDRNGVGCEKK